MFLLLRDTALLYSSDWSTGAYVSDTARMAALADASSLPSQGPLGVAEGEKIPSNWVLVSRELAAHSRAAVLAYDPRQSSPLSGARHRPTT